MLAGKAGNCWQLEISLAAVCACEVLPLETTTSAWWDWLLETAFTLLLRKAGCSTLMLLETASAAAVRGWLVKTAAAGKDWLLETAAAGRGWLLEIAVASDRDWRLETAALPGKGCLLQSAAAVAAAAAVAGKDRLLESGYWKLLLSLM